MPLSHKNLFLKILCGSWISERDFRFWITVPDVVASGDSWCLRSTMITQTFFFYLHCWNLPVFCLPIIQGHRTQIDIFLMIERHSTLGPPRYVLWCNGSICHEVLTLFQIGCDLPVLWKVINSIIKTR